MHIENNIKYYTNHCNNIKFGYNYALIKSKVKKF